LNSDTSLCVDADGAQTNRGVLLKTCDGSLSHVWRIDRRRRIRNKDTDRCLIKQGTGVINKGCPNITENDVTRGFDDTIAFGIRGAMTPSAAANGEIALSVAARIGTFSEIVGPDVQEFTFVYL